jgi:hypothetical protein
VGPLAEIKLRSDDPAASARLSKLINAQLALERAAEVRRAWTALVALASVPTSLSLLFPAVVHRALTRPSLALWASGAVAALMAWMSERRAGRDLGIALRDCGVAASLDGSGRPAQPSSGRGG